jgi:uncharacterized phage protein (TIGR02218 family)
MSAALWLAAPLVPAAWCWRLERRDGIAVLLTSHDCDLVLGGNVYRAAPGMRPSQIEQNDRIESHSIDLSGAISSAAIDSDDIAAGRWDGAALTLMLANWDDPNAPVQVVATGRLGSLVQRGHEFAVELSGPLMQLDAAVGVATSPTCRAAFGDRDCRVALAQHSLTARVTAVDDNWVTVDAALAPGVLALGHLRWLDGAASGIDTVIAEQDGARLLLADMPPLLPALPARVRLRAGCDKRLDTCAARFANAVNFRGEAHLPGFDLLMRYPGG